MKKILFALLAVCAVSLSFTSCNSMADPEKEPVANRQFYMEDASGYSEFRFHMDHSLTLFVRTATVPVQETENSLFVWSMNKMNVIVKGANGTNFAGKVFFSGEYDPDAKTITGTVTNIVNGDTAPAVLKEKVNN